MMKQEHFYHQPIGISNRTIKIGKIEILFPFNHLINSHKNIFFTNGTLRLSKKMKYHKILVLCNFLKNSKRRETELK